MEAMPWKPEKVYGRTVRGAGLRELTGGQVTPETNNLENSSLQLFFYIAIIVEQIVVGFVSIIVLLIGSSSVDAHLYYGM